MVAVPRLWPGATVVCLATGPSLTREDVEFVRGKARVIAVNDAHRLAPWADVLYSSDRTWWTHYKGVPSFTGMRYGIGSAPNKANPFVQFPEITVLRNAGYEGLELSPSGLKTGKNSGYAAINLAVHFGAARVVLLGYDLGWSGGKAHFFGSHPPNMSQTEAHFPTFRKLFRTMVEPLRDAGVDVVNCSRRTSLEAFPCAALEAAFAPQQAAA